MSATISGMTPSPSWQAEGLQAESLANSNRNDDISPMRSVSLVSLIVDYEVPPSLIIEAIKDGRLKPVAQNDEAITLTSVAFEREDCDNLFWAYELKYKSAQEKADLLQRFQRYDAIVAALIGAVVGVGITALSSAAFGEQTTDWTPARQKRPPIFQSPLEEPIRRFELAESGAGFISIRLRPGLGRSFCLLAAGNGRVMRNGPPPHEYEESRVCIDHGGGWWSTYTIADGFGVMLGGDKRRIKRGRAVLEVSSQLNSDAIAHFSIWREESLDHWISHLELIRWPPFLFKRRG